MEPYTEFHVLPNPVYSTLYRSRFEYYIFILAIQSVHFIPVRRNIHVSHINVESQVGGVKLRWFFIAMRLLKPSESTSDTV